MVKASLDTSCTLRLEQEVLGRTVEFGESRTHSVHRVPLAEVDQNSVDAERREGSPGGIYSLEPYFPVVVSIAGARELIEDSLVLGTLSSEDQC